MASSAVRTGRALLVQKHHCSGGDILIGSATVSGSIFALLLIGFIVGLAVGAAVTLAVRRRREKRALLPTQQTSAKVAQAPTHPAPYWAAANGAQHRRTQSTLYKEDAVRRSGVTGPLGVGVVMQSIDHAKVKGGNMQQDAGDRASDIWSVVDLHSEQNACPNMGAGLPEAPIAVSPPPAGLHARTTIAAGWGDPIGSGAQQAPGAVGGRAQPRQGAPAPPPPPMPARGASQPPADAHVSIEMTRGAAVAQPAARQQLSKEKQRAAAGVAKHYALDDLDPEWHALLNELDDRLIMQGKPGMDEHERAVAIRSLLVSTARESPDMALRTAVADIERFRRTPS